MNRTTGILMTALLFAATTAYADDDAEIKPFQGKWEVVELAEDGKVIPREAIQEWLPSGGRFEIEDNAILFRSHDDGKVHVKVFSVDATQFPKGIDLMSRDKKDALGIFQFDEGRLVLCLADSEGAQRPKDFSAAAGSKQVLMTLQRIPEKTPKQPETAKPQPSGTTAKLVTDAQVKKMLAGSWRYNDNHGALLVTYNSDGTFSTVREVQEIRLFQKMFVQTPISSGKWNVENGTLKFSILKSVQRDRVNREFDFSVRSITDRDFIFVDYLGRVGQAARIR